MYGLFGRTVQQTALVVRYGPKSVNNFRGTLLEIMRNLLCCLALMLTLKVIPPTSCCPSKVGNRE